MRRDMRVVVFLSLEYFYARGGTGVDVVRPSYSSHAVVRNSSPRILSHEMRI